MMKAKLRVIACSLMVCTALFSWAQAPSSGTYKIRSVGGTYVQIKGKYYAKPDATSADASEVGVGVGYKDGDNGYRVYSLSGTNPNDGSQIEIYSYVEKACNIVSQFAQDELDKKLGTGADKGPKQEALDAMADSICRIYTDDYAYMTILPQAHYGDKWIVRAKATVPAIPYTVQAIGNYIVVGDEVIAGHKCTDVWDWAKQHVLKYINDETKQTDSRLRELVKKYLDQVTPGTTYYLRYDADDNSFGYETTPSDNGLWTMEVVKANPDGLTPGVFNIQNNDTKKYVSVTGKYYAEPDLESIKTESDKKDAAVNVQFGRYDRNHSNLYRISELSNQGRDIVAYIYKGMQKANEIVDSKLKEKSAYDAMAGLLNDMIDSKNAKNQENGLDITIPQITAAQIQADVKTAFDLCAEHYAYMKLIDNGDNTVSLRVDVPKVPAALDLAIQMYKNDENATFIEFAKEQIDKYFDNPDLQTDENLRKLWRQNRDKWEAGQNYYLSADNLSSTNPATQETKNGTFQFTTDPSDASTKWLLADINDANSTTNPFRGIFRGKNVGGYNGQQYIDVRGRITADVSATNEDKVTKPGTILYVNLNAEPTEISSPYEAGKTVKAYEVLNLRSQGIDVMNGAEMSMDELTSISNPYDGYVGFARYMLSTFSTLATNFIPNYINKEIFPNADEATLEGYKTTFNNLMKDFNTNYLPELKFQVYLIPVEGQTDTYLVRSIIPSMKPISDFYNANKTDCDRVLLPAVRYALNSYSYLLKQYGFTGEDFTDDDDAIINAWYRTEGGEWHVKNICDKNPDGSLKYTTDENGVKHYTWNYSTILSSDFEIFEYLKLQAYHAAKALGREDIFNGYFNMIHYNTPYYLIEGDNHDADGNRVWTGSVKLGFANDGLNAGTANGSGTIQNDLTNAGDHAYWTLEPVDDTNYFTVKPNQNQARNGKYYSSTYLDFPFQIKGSNVSAVYTLDDKGVQNGTEKDGTTTYQYVTFDKADGVIPAATPVIIEFNTNTVDNTLALEPVLSNARTAEQSSLIEGTFLGGNHKGDHKDDASGTLATILQYIHNLYKGSLQDKWGVQTDGKDLYLFGYNKKDEHNPYGFYIYHRWSDDTDKVIPANKPFLIQDPNSPAKVYVMFDDETTDIENILPGTETIIPADVPRYNLAGQRVDKAYKGVVIVKGHKYVQQ